MSIDSVFFYRIYKKDKEKSEIEEKFNGPISELTATSKEKELKPSIPLNLNFREFQHEVGKPKLYIMYTMHKYSEMQFKNTFNPCLI